MGKQQHFALGQWTRARYQKFLPYAFNVNDTYVRSSDVDRTIMSAMSNLAGLYPPSGKQIWNKNIPWQPIPVHVTPADVDYITGGSLPPCKAYELATNVYLQSDELKKVNKSVEPLYNYLTSSLGVTIGDLSTLLLIRDTLFCESSHNLA